jgi:hypothetical protein
MSYQISFEDCDCGSVDIISSWKSSVKYSTKECQTSPELYQFEDAEVQTGLFTEIIEEVVNRDDTGYQLSSFLSKYHHQNHRSHDDWNQLIREGKVGVDGEIVTNPDSLVEPEQYIEFVNISCNAQVIQRTSLLALTLSLSHFLISSDTNPCHRFWNPN